MVRVGERESKEEEEDKMSLEYKPGEFNTDRRYSQDRETAEQSQDRETTVHKL